MKIYLDDVRKAPDGYVLCLSVNQAISMIKENRDEIEELDLDHDLGDFAVDGGDAIKLLDWCVENDFYPKIILHTANPVGRRNMERLIERYWRKDG